MTSQGVLTPPAKIPSVFDAVAGWCERTPGAVRYAPRNLIAGYYITNASLPYILTPALTTCPLSTNSRCGKERRILSGPW